MGVTPEMIHQLEAPIPWIGMYTAVASLICTVAMAADAFRGVSSRKYWFPSKYFSLDATSLTLLAVSLKLQLDLTTKLHSATDRLAKVSSLVFMSTAMANCLTSLGSMDDRSVLMNVTALAILVITLIGNVCLQVIQMRSYLPGRKALFEELVALAAMLLLLVMFISTALMIPSTKHCLELKYLEMHKSAVINEEDQDKDIMTTDKLKVRIKKHFVMAETSNPQFVIARSVTATAAGVLSLFVALLLVEAEIRITIKYGVGDEYSSYKWSTKWILLFQTVGVMVGTIAPAFRWFLAINYRSASSCDGVNNTRMSPFTVEVYWTEKMMEWRHTSSSSCIRHLRSRKVVHNVKGFTLRICIFLQYLIVMSSNLVLLVSVVIATPITSCLKRSSKSGKVLEEDCSTENTELDMSHYVMLLEGEVELPAETLHIIYKQVDRVIKRGKRQKPKNLLKLLNKSCNFNGVTEFDCPKVPYLAPQELTYCWSLPIVALTCIARALPNIEKEKSDGLLSSVTEGFRFVMLIDKMMDEQGGLGNIRSAGEVMWVDVELRNRWQDKDLDQVSANGKNAQEILKQLHEEAENTVVEFKRGARTCMRNPLNWPAKVIAANAMYRVSRTILMKQRDGTDEELFQQLSIMIADILAACFTNLPRIISIMCHRNAIEERWSRVDQAAVLLGETEDIIALLHGRQLPKFFASEQAACIEEWINLEIMNGEKSMMDSVTIKVEV
ncbi:hypothetical protein ACS0TY_032571 [Phlomoides rotata]